MNKYTLAAVGIACIAAGTTASAATFIEEDIIGTKMDLGDTLAYSLDYDSSTWASINSATLTIFLSDSNDTDIEFAALDAISGTANANTLTPNISAGPNLDPSGSIGYFDLNILSLLEVGSAYQVNGSMSNFLGDYTFDKAQLNVDYSPVPVPAAVWLFGSAIAGLGFARRRNLNA